MGGDERPIETVAAVAIDGPAGAGKSTVAKALARRLGWRYVDTGAMYRAVTLEAVRRGVDLEGGGDELPRTLARITREAAVDLCEEDGALRVLLGGEDVTSEVRTPELTRLVRYLARSGPARAEMVKKQQALASAGSVVMEGRDIGTVVLTRAAAKFYLDATVSERARRRAGDLERAGEQVDAAALEKEIASRDLSDRERADGPLKVADDAEVVDTTRMSVEEVVDHLASRTRARLAGGVKT
ncbi:MAG: (d)CMP kinase [Planctomycetota bacterium]